MAAADDKAGHGSSEITDAQRRALREALEALEQALVQEGADVEGEGDASTSAMLRSLAALDPGTR